MAKRHRSPSYPALTLTDSLEKARALFAEEGRNPTPVNVVVSHWGYSPKSSGGAAAVAALKAWGLAEDEGTGSQRTVRLSDRGLTIIQDTRDDATERNRLLYEAAKSPKIMRELFDEYPDGSVSDGNLNFFLVQRAYNPNAVSDIIKAYRDALSYVWPGSGTGGEASEDDPDDEEDFSDIGQTRHHLPKRGKGMKQDTFSLEEGDVSLLWPSNLTQESFNDLKDWLAIMERKIRRSVRTSDDAEEES